MANTYGHLEATRSDIRDEIKRRIEQRDKYSVQLTVSLAAIVAAAFSRPGLERVLLAGPLVSVYYTVLILYSYQIHSLLAQFLREQIEPALAKSADLPLDVEWESYYHKRAVPGIRRRFFWRALLFVYIGSMALLWFTQYEDMRFRYVLAAATLVYGLACWSIHRWFLKES